MTAENVYQNLPSKEEATEIKSIIEAEGGKIIFIDKVPWFNFLTRRKGIVEDMPILATSDCGDRPYAVTHIVVRVLTTQGATIEPNVDYVFNKFYAHVNINGNGSCIKTFVRELGGGKYKKVSVYGQAICSPITQHHFYTKPLTELALIWKGQLQGQNNDSPYQQVTSVSNDFMDRALFDNGIFLKANAPTICLALCRTQDRIRGILEKDSSELRRLLSDRKIDVMTADDVLVKYHDLGSYTIISKEKYVEHKDLISTYYPVITYEQVTDIAATLPKTEVDFTFLGLGSASTGILAQVARSNYMNSCLLVDKDTVEQKNLRNQWYTDRNIDYSKAESSKSIVDSIKRGGSTIAKRMWFQEVSWPDYVTKYLISGFDSIKTRQEALEYIKDGKITAQYLIDTRYDDLSSSIYFIDLSKEKEVEYYEKGLQADADALKEAGIEDNPVKFIETDEEFLDYLERENVFHSTCHVTAGNLFPQGTIHNSDSYCGIEADPNDDGRRCGGKKCQAKWLEAFHTWKPRIMPERVASGKESSCVKQNLIDIYQYTSSFVFAAIREIENGNDKPFIHIEAQTEGIPTSMVIKK